MSRGPVPALKERLLEQPTSILGNLIPEAVMLNIVEILALRGLDLSARTKLVRHQDKRYDMGELRRKGLFELYQRFQRRPVFECDYIVSFVGTERATARMVGVYRVLGRVSSADYPLPPDFEYPWFSAPGGYYYELEKVGGFEDLNDRVIIDWGSGALAWHQWLNEKEVVEVLPTGYVREFPGYLDFVLSFDELSTIFQAPEANREWHRMLSAVAGVYLITDLVTGKQYVGSAYGGAGILGRWETYVHTLHGGDALLRDLVEPNPAYAHHFQFTILRTLPLTMVKKEVIEYEGLYKRKLGTRAFGLNAN